MHPIYRTFPQPPQPIILTEVSPPTPSLVLVCRQLFHETALLPLSRNNVSCTSFTVLSFLPTRLTYSQREQITSIRVHSAIEKSPDVAALVTLRDDRTYMQLLPVVHTIIIEVTRVNPEVLPLWQAKQQAKYNAKMLEVWLKKGRGGYLRGDLGGKWWVEASYGRGSSWGRGSGSGRYD